MITVLGVIVLLTVLGTSIARAIHGRVTSRLLLLGLGYLYGCGAVYCVLLAFAIAGFRWSSIAITTSLVLIALLALAATTRRATASDPDPHRVTFCWLDVVTVAVIALFTLHAAIAAPQHWDFWSIWGLKGRVFYEARGLDWQFLGSRWNQFSHPDYPPLLPFNYAYVALVSGGWTDRWMGLLSAAFGVAAIAIVRSESAREVSPFLASIITLAATAFALSPQIGLAEAPLIAFGCGGIILVRSSLRLNDPGLMRHGAILLGLAAATKNEGITLCAAAALALLMTAKRAQIMRLWPAFVIAVPWVIVRSLHRLQTDITSSGVLERAMIRVHALPQLLSAMSAALSNQILWLVLVVSLLVMGLRSIREEIFTLSAVVIQLLFFVSAYVATPLDAAWHVASSFGRISAQLGLPFLFATTMVIARRVAAVDHLIESSPSNSSFDPRTSTSGPSSYTLR